MIKERNVISVLLIPFVIFLLEASSVVAAHGATDPQAGKIKQTIKSSIEDRGFTVDFDGDVDSWENANSWGYQASSVGQGPGSSYIRIMVFHYFNEQDAIDTMDAWCTSANATSTTLHGYPACYNLNFAINVDLTTEAVYYWRAGTLFFSFSVSPPEDLFPSAETVYANAQKYGLLTGGTTDPDADKDGVPDNSDKCSNTAAGAAVDADGCSAAQSMRITISVDKTDYAPGDTAVISGKVSDSNGPLAGVAVSVNVSGTMLSATTNASGNYQVNFPIPANVSQVSYQTTATATHANYQDAGVSIIFGVQDGLIVELSADADHYLIGDTVNFTITVKDSKNNLVPSANLNITATRLDSGKTTQLTATTDGIGEHVWRFTWGKDNTGKTIAEGKLKIDVTASKNGYADGSATKTLAGCGDLEKNGEEDCLDCPEDCACTGKEVCDPSGSRSNPTTFCSPKMAYVFISRGLGWYHEWWASDDIREIRRYYKSKGYTVPASIYVDHINQVAKYLTRPSTKAIAYAGHGEEPGGTPTIEAAAATTGAYPVKSAINTISSQPGGFLYICQFETYAAKWVENRDTIEAIALGQVNNPNLEYVFMFSCYSLDNNSLRDYLLESGGTYWGYRGKLPGNGTLTKSIKP